MKVTVILLLAGLLNTFLFVIVHRSLVLHVAALRQQLAVFKRRLRKPRLRGRDRLFWAVLSRIWPSWKSALIIVKPETVIRWQKKRFRDFWRKRSTPGPGRPRIPKEHIDYIRRISSDHPEYGKARIALEMEIKFGIKHSPTTVGKYMVKTRGKPRGTQSWGTFLKNQADAIWSCDFLVQYTVGFTALYVFVFMELGRPTTVERQCKRVSCRSALDLWLFETMNIRGIPIPYGAPNAQSHVERLIDTLRRECLDRMLIWNERQLRAVLGETVDWYNRLRVHQDIHGIPQPDPESKPTPTKGRLVSIPVLNGLHHDYRLAA